MGIVVASLACERGQSLHVLRALAEEPSLQGRISGSRVTDCTAEEAGLPPGHDIVGRGGSISKADCLPRILGFKKILFRVFERYCFTAVN